MTNEERLANVATHVERLAGLLSKIAPEGVNQRLYRARGIINDEYTVITLVQHVPVHWEPGDRYGHPAVKIQLYVSRAYVVANTVLSGQYATDEIVAFLGLDTVDPDTLSWVDETRYDGLVIAHGILPPTILHG